MDQATLRRPAGPRGPGGPGGRPRGVVQRGRGHNWWEVTSAAPAAVLRPHVRRYIDFREQAPGPICRYELPSGEVPLIIMLGPAMRLTYPDGQVLAATQHRQFVAGLHDMPVLTETQRAQHGVQVMFSPTGAYALFGQPMDTLANRAVELEDLLGTAAARELTERLWHAPDATARFDLLDAALSARLADGRAPALEVQWAWERLCQTSGRASIGALSLELGWSRKHLIDQFRTQLGLPPKRLARILRFQQAVQLLERAGAPDWAILARDCGYYDQSHLIRDFRAFTGVAPTEFAARHVADLGGLELVKSFQDAAGAGA